MSGAKLNGGAVIDLGGGMDKLSQHMLEGACTKARDAVMRRGRAVLVLAIAADGPHAARSFAHRGLTNVSALAFAEQVHEYAEEIKRQALQGLFSG